MKIKQIVCILVSFYFGGAYAQSEAEIAQIEQRYGELIPNSPEAQGFKKHGDTEVSLYTGQPKTNIPLYTIKGREITFPVSLFYNSSGVKVDQIASWVGLGWHLNAGGAVNRIINGLSDDETNNNSGYKKHYQSTMSQYIQTYSGNGPVIDGVYNADYLYDYLFDFEVEAVNNRLDTQPDIYNFTVNGFSGDFFIDYDSETGVCINDPTVKIIPVFDELGTTSNPNKCITGFTIFNADGTQYEFFKPESKRVLTNSPYQRDINTYNSAWNLTRVVSASKKDTLKFNYTSLLEWEYQRFVTDVASISNLISEGSAAINCGSPQNYEPYLATSSPTVEWITTMYPLESIYLNGQEIMSFHTKSQERIDLDGGVKALDHILIKNDEEVINKATFHTSYFETSNPPGDALQYRRRLKLDKVVFGTDDIEEYAFEYIGNGNIPSRLSKSRDYWGYFNNRNNSTLVPKSEIITGTFGDGGNRETHTDPNIVGIGTLRKITYPTRGYSTFEHSVHNLPPEPVQHQIETVLMENFQGGVSPSDEFDFFQCGGPTYNTPIGSHFWFSINETTEVTFLVDTQNSMPGENTGWSLLNFLAIYPEGYNGSSQPITDFCTLYQNTNIPISEINTSQSLHTPSSSVEYIATLAPGDYWGLFLSNHWHMTSTITMEYEETVYEIKYVGGLRVDKITDYTNQGEIGTQKKYFYEDISSYNFNPTLNNPSSAVLHTPDQFTEVVTFEMSQTCNFTSLLYETRYAQNLSGKSENHIAYSKVSEIVLDHEDNFMSAEVFEFSNGFFNVLHSGQNYSGHNRLNGKLLKHKMYNQSEKMVYEKSVGYQNVHDSANQLTPLPVELIFWPETRILGGTFAVKFYEGGLLKEAYKSVQGYSVSIPDPNTGVIVSVFTCAPPSPFFSNQVSYTQVQWEGNCSSGNTGPIYKMLSNQGMSIWAKLDQITEEYFYYNTNGSLTGSLQEIKSFEYDNTDHYQVTKRTFSTNNSQEEEILNLYYPHDLPNDPHMNSLISDHRIASPIKTEALKKQQGIEVPVSTQLEKYHNFNGLILPRYFQDAKGTNNLETRIQYDLYDANGNPLQLSMTNGPKTSYIWGYNGQHPVAKIENKAYNAIPAGLVSAIHTASTTGTEAQLLTALETLRNDLALEGAMVTTYTYKPLVGISTVTDPKGDMMTYHYDAFGRLEAIKDKDENLMEEYEYNYGTN